MLSGERVSVYCDNHTEHTNTLCGQNAEQVGHVATIIGYFKGTKFWVKNSKYDTKTTLWKRYMWCHHPTPACQGSLLHLDLREQCGNCTFLLKILSDMPARRIDWSERKALDFYSRGARFQSRPGHQPSWLRFFRGFTLVFPDIF
jgi:hypothetical protein